MQNAASSLIKLVEFSGDGALQGPNQSELENSSVDARLADLAFTDLVARHSRVLFKIAMAVTRHAHDAEDAVQEAFLELYRGKRWQQLDDARAYLARITWRIAVRRHKTGSGHTEQEFPRTFASSEPTPEDRVIDRQLESQLHLLIDMLPEKLRQPLALSGVGELSQVEIARILRLPEGTVRRRIHTARQQLREQWKQGGKS